MTVQRVVQKTKLTRLGRGVLNDIRNLLPVYVDDWKAAWNYRVVPATVYMFMANLLPALSFCLDLHDRTHQFGVNEILLGSALGGVIFGLFGHGLCIVGETGPICIFYAVCYNIVEKLEGADYFQFMCWVCIWSAIMHWIIALSNWVKALKLVTRFSCDIFGFFICVIYIEKGIQILQRQFEMGTKSAGYLSIVVGLLVVIFGLLGHIIGKSSLFNNTIRNVFDDYSTPAAVIFFTGFIYFGGNIESNVEKLPITKSFAPTSPNRPEDWFIRFWHLSVGNIFLALPFGLLLTILFYFDHNVSSLICQASEFPLKRPSAFHWEFFLLGITTLISGFLGIPPPNGLIPQAPLHTKALCVIKTRGESRNAEQYIDSVVEQRFTNTVQGLLILGTMTRPLLVCLGLIPAGVLAGLFWIMGFTGLMGNGITNYIKYAFGDHRYADPDDPLNKVRKRSLYIFIVLSLIGAAAEVGISQADSAVGFPAVLLLFVAVGRYMYWVIPSQDLDKLDGPTASDYILESL